MATLTVRNLPATVVQSLKALAKHNHRSMEQEARQLIETHVGDRLSAIAQIKRAWAAQERAPSADEIDGWIRKGRE